MAELQFFQVAFEDIPVDSIAPELRIVAARGEELITADLLIQVSSKNQRRVFIISHQTDSLFYEIIYRS